MKGARDQFRELQLIENTRRPREPVSAEAIARLSDEGKDVSRFLTNTGRMMRPPQKVNVVTWRRACRKNWTGPPKS